MPASVPGVPPFGPEGGVRICGKIKYYAGHGGRVSPSAVVMARWMFENKALFDGKTVLELGAGNGFLGIFAAGLGSPKVLCVDNHPTVVRLAATNVDVNYDLINSRGSQVIVNHIGWENVPNDGATYDWILCSDCVYEALFNPAENQVALCKGLADLIARMPSARVLFAIQERVEDTVGAFTERVAPFGLQTTVIDTDYMIEKKEELEIKLVEVRANR